MTSLVGITEGYREVFKDFICLLNQQMYAAYRLYRLKGRWTQLPKPLLAIRRILINVKLYPAITVVTAITRNNC